MGKKKKIKIKLTRLARLRLTKRPLKVAYNLILTRLNQKLKRPRLRQRKSSKRPRRPKLMPLKKKLMLMLPKPPPKRKRPKQMARLKTKRKRIRQNQRLSETIKLQSDSVTFKAKGQFRLKKFNSFNF